jgi:hypothetical protein
MEATDEMRTAKWEFTRLPEWHLKDTVLRKLCKRGTRLL